MQNENHKGGQRKLWLPFIKNVLPESFMHLHLWLIPGEHRIYMGTGPIGLVTSSYSEKDGGSDEDKKICIMCRDH